MITSLAPQPSSNADIRTYSVRNVMGLPLASLTFEETLEQIDQLIATGEAGYFITANLHYAMLSSREQRLRGINQEAAFLLADGMPLVWASQLRGQPLPERVAGSDLVPALCKRSAEKGFRVYFLGAGPEVAQQAAERMQELYPDIEIVGVLSPEPADFQGERNEQLIQEIREAQPHLLFVALGQPKGEYWIHENYERLEGTICVQIGATFDFMAGRVPRAPRWMQRTGLEWVYRIAREPGRMIPRYTADALFLVRQLASALLPTAVQRPASQTESLF